MLVCALGDLVLDVVVRLAAPPAEGGDTPAEIVLGPGGQAANVAAWAVELGASARLVCKSGADNAGRLVRDGLTGRGVEVVGPIEGSTGVVCALVAEDGQRSMATNRGVAPTLAATDLDPGWFEGRDHLF
ncbi:MAG TPA: carbohydrate kinase family protein, partial [Gaiellaceae bacterium]|nr:carbohydrate kinase family protein [Gaiellaceae bacterium]